MYSYAGMNGSAITSDFEYFDSKFINPGLDNGTNALIGLFPYLVYEVRWKRESLERVGVL